VARSKKVGKSGIEFGKSIDDFIEEASVNVEEEKREKTFLLRMPYSLWMEAKKRALEEEMTLHDFILKCIKESVQSS